MEVHSFRRVRIGFANGWLVRSRKGLVLVDAGFARREGRLAYALRREGLEARDIKLILVTHAHFDHVGALAAIRRHTGAAVAIHAAEAEFLRTGTPHLPGALSPWADLALAYGRRRPEEMAVEPVEPDVIIDGELDLAGWGLDGRVIETPGHSPGSVSLLLDDGTAFVGDVAVSSFPRLLGVRASVFGDDAEEVRRSWRRLLAPGRSRRDICSADLTPGPDGCAGARIICPGHGPAFPAERLDPDRSAPRA